MQVHGGQVLPESERLGAHHPAARQVEGLRPVAATSKLKPSFGVARTGGSPAARARPARRSARPGWRPGRARASPRSRCRGRARTRRRRRWRRVPVARRHSLLRSSSVGRRAAQPSPSKSGSCPRLSRRARRCAPPRSGRWRRAAAALRIGAARGGQPALAAARPARRGRAKVASRAAGSAGANCGATGSACPTSRCSRPSTPSVRATSSRASHPAASSATRASRAARRHPRRGAPRRGAASGRRRRRAHRTAKPLKASIAPRTSPGGGGGRQAAARRRGASSAAEPSARAPGSATSRPACLGGAWCGEIAPVQVPRLGDQAPQCRPPTARSASEPSPEPRPDGNRAAGGRGAGLAPRREHGPRRPRPVCSPTGARKTTSIAASPTSASVAWTTPRGRLPVGPREADGEPMPAGPPSMPASQASRPGAASARPPAARPARPSRPGRGRRAADGSPPARARRVGDAQRREGRAAGRRRRERGRALWDVARASEETLWATAASATASRSAASASSTARPARSSSASREERREPLAGRLLGVGHVVGGQSRAREQQPVDDRRRRRRVADRGERQSAQLVGRWSSPGVAVQAALEARPEEPSEVLALADAVDEPACPSHPVRGEIDGQRRSGHAAECRPAASQDRRRCGVAERGASTFPCEARGAGRGLARSTKPYAPIWMPSGAPCACSPGARTPPPCTTRRAGTGHAERLAQQALELAHRVLRRPRDARSAPRARRPAAPRRPVPVACSTLQGSSWPQQRARLVVAVRRREAVTTPATVAQPRAQPVSSASVRPAATSGGVRAPRSPQREVGLWLVLVAHHAVTPGTFSPASRAGTRAPVGAQEVHHLPLEVPVADLPGHRLLRGREIVRHHEDVEHVGDRPANATCSSILRARRSRR